MSFAQSAQNLRVDDGHILRGQLQNVNGDWVDAELDLNSCIGNDWGNFQWGGENFSGSSQDINFTVEGDASVPVLRAVIDDGNGGHNQRDLNLGERIQNSDGQLVFI
ncbi:Cyanovirin-N [Microthyrium microscopicum]|uniref:Cyanovirin-N n=1 Tax=Microthyrium microscopicum TaxID=703497 RepID=A0A6A6UPG7_9PEZI|nr:Cyanovirin-N [Microthyrium microscopicum]